MGKSVSILNPSDQPIHVQLLPFADPNDASAILPSFKSSVNFKLPTEATVGEVVPPHGRIDLGPLYFAPLSLEKGMSPQYSSLLTQLSTVNATLYVKNNLTILDSFVVVGEGGSGRLLFHENETEVSELLFQLDHTHLRHCISQGLFSPLHCLMLIFAFIWKTLLCESPRKWSC